jgi:hypothetical protein
MKDFDSLAAAARGAEQVFFPNRYQDPFIEAWRELTGEEPPKMEGREESAEANGRLFRWVRGRNVAFAVDRMKAVNPGVRAVGLTGSEWVDEYKALEPGTGVASGIVAEKELGRVAVIAPPGSNVPLLEARLKSRLNPVGVVTVYPGLVRSLALGDNCNLTVDEAVDGCVEAWAAALDKPGVDLVSPQARTIKANNFSLVRPLVTSYPVLVMSGQPETTA